MESIYVGKIVNTHGIKGELRILSSFEWKEKVFFIGNHLYLGKKLEEVTITSYRRHKNFDMVTLEGYHNINEVLKYKGLSVYVPRTSINLQEGEYLDKDFIGLTVWVEKDKKGIIKGIRTLSRGNKLFEIEDNGKVFLVPYQKDFIEKVDLENKAIYIIKMKGLFE